MSIEAMKVEGPLHLVCQCDKCKAEKQEPVGRFAKFTDGIWREVAEGSAGVPLYTTPQQRKPLTDKDIRKAKHHMVDGAYQYSFMQGVRYAEAARGIKE